VADLLKLKPEALLLRWFNYHLEKVGYEGAKIKNFGKDLAVRWKLVPIVCEVEGATPIDLNQPCACLSHLVASIRGSLLLALLHDVMLQDGTRYAALLHSIDSSSIPATVPGTAEGRASAVLDAARVRCRCRCRCCCCRRRRRWLRRALCVVCCVLCRMVGECMQL